MEDILRCGNIVPKFPGGPPQGGSLIAGYLALTLLPSLAASYKLDPEPTPWKGQAGFAG
jgi:hypothetical protein